MAPSDVEHLNKTAIYERARESCDIPHVLYDTEPLIDGWHAHDLMTLIAGICLVATFLTSLGTATWHLRNYTVPREQRQIVRIVWTPFIYGNIYFFSLWFYKLESYLLPVADLYEIFALVAIYLLFLAYVCPEHENYEHFFARFDRSVGKKGRKSGGSLYWFCFLSFGVLQIFPSHIATAVSTWYNVATECPLSKHLQHQNLVISIVNGVVLAIMVLCIVQIRSGIKPELKPRKATRKLVVFKIIIIIVQIQPIVFTALLEDNTFKPTTHMSVFDWIYGLPYFLTVLEMTIFSFIFVFVFGASEYKRMAKVDAQDMGNIEGKSVVTNVPSGRMGFFRAFFHVINYGDVIKRAWLGLTFTGLVKQLKRQKQEPSYVEEHEG